jgi:serine/threonine protein phosphatase 1
MGAGTPLTYAIGDIHGRLDLLTTLLAQIEQHRAGRDRTIVFLGDYIDRGPESAGVIATVRRLQAREPGCIVCLKGNHEDLMLKAYRDESKVNLWVMNGGYETMASFGPDVPAEVLRWAEGLPTVHEDAHRFYVHAGFRPGRPGPDPSEHVRLWMREPFLSRDYDFGKHVVHGHTPLRMAQPDPRPFRTNLDTGAVLGGALTAGVFTNDQAHAIEFLQARDAKLPDSARLRSGRCGETLNSRQLSLSGENGVKKKLPR